MHLGVLMKCRFGTSFRVTATVERRQELLELIFATWKEVHHFNSVRLINVNVIWESYTNMTSHV